jgi:hypothetical protein
MIAERAHDAGWVAEISHAIKQASWNFSNQKQFVRMHHFSDSIFLSTPPGHEDFLYLCCIVSGLASHFLDLGHPLRGGIACGLVYHEDDIVVGPALVRAYELESKTAIHPRIIFDPEMKMNEPTSFVLTDIDGVKYVDVLSPYLLDLYETCIQPNFKLDLARVKTFVVRMAADNLRPSVQLKYQWLLNFIDRRRPATGLHGKPSRFGLR